MVFRQYNQFDTDLIQIIYRLSTDYLQVLLHKDYILSICRLSTDYIKVLHNTKTDYFGTKLHLILVDKKWILSVQNRL